MSKIAKIWVSIAGIALIAVIVQLGIFIHSHIQVNKIHQQEANAQEIYDHIDTMFINQDSGFIVKEMTELDLLDIRESMANLEEVTDLPPNLIATYNDLHQRYYAQDAVNNMFQTAVIVDDIINSNMPYIEVISNAYVQETVAIFRFEEESDFFKETINLFIDDAWEQTSYYELATTKLNEIEYIPVLPGNIQSIAQGMKEAEDAYGQVYNETLLNNLNEAFQAYATDFMTTVNATYPDIVNDPELQNAMEISPYLSRLLSME